LLLEYSEQTYQKLQIFNKYEFCVKFNFQWCQHDSYFREKRTVIFQGERANEMLFWKFPSFK
jgi:hypothetical protein